MDNMDNMDNMSDETAFSALVRRELMGRVTRTAIEERAYLGSSQEIIKRWRATLVGMVEAADAHKDRVRTDMRAVWQACLGRSNKEAGQEEWNRYRVIGEHKLSQTRSFIHRARQRIVEVNLLVEQARADARALAHEQAVAKAQEQPKTPRQRTAHKGGYYAGFGAALGTIRWLIESGCDVSEACEEVHTFMRETLRPWRDSDNPDEPVPAFGRPERIVERKQKSA